MTKRASLSVIRRELKWIVDAAEADRLEALIETRVPHRAWFPPEREFIVRSTYLDYPDRSLSAEVFGHPDESIKVRYKRYESPREGHRTADVSVWLETKERFQDLVTKQRTKVPGSILPDILERREPPPAGFEAILERGTLEPIAGVSYRRVAFEEKDESLRVTIDRDLAIVRPGPWRSLGTEVARPNFCIVEVKPLAAIPEWIEEVFLAPPVLFSKFELAAKELSLFRQ